MINIGNKKRGFTLVESLVAISILSLSILAGFTAVQNGLKSSIAAKNETAAFYLVQEAMEYIKNVRDNNALNALNGGTNTWLTGITAQASDPCYFGKTCYIDSTNGTVATCTGNSSATCEYLRKSPTTGLLGYTAGWTQTNFKRTITIQSISANEISVTILISWTQGVLNKSFQVSETLFNRN